MTLDVRLYQSSDRESVFRIAADTAFFGDPVEKFLDDRRLFCDAFCASYIDLEAEQCWIATAGDEVVGFLLGCTDTRTHDRRWRRQYLLKLLQRAVSGFYRIGERTWRYALELAGAYLRKEIPIVNLRTYPAHLHINLDARWRGYGLDSRLIGAYLDQLRQLKVPGVHLMTTSKNGIACHLYEKMGFYLLDSRSTHIWKGIVAERVENRCYGLIL